MLQARLTLFLYVVSVFPTMGGHDSNFSPWSPWSACSQYCGPGEQFRTRACVKDGDCNGMTIEIMTCYISKCYLSCREYFEDGYSSSGVYPLFVDGPCERPIQTVCEQSRRFGGGWTLLVQVFSSEGWNETSVLMRNAYVTGKAIGEINFSILRKADAIKHDPMYKSPFYYRLEADGAGRWGGVWQAPNYYTFTGMYGNLTSVTLLKKFDYWSNGPFAIGNRMPWLPKNDDKTLLTTNDKGTQEIPWGTIVASDKWHYGMPPWISPWKAFPGVIRYWLKENKKEYQEPDIFCPTETPLPVDGGYNVWSEWGPCSETCSTGHQVRIRYCNNPRPANGGKDCFRLGPSRETRVCNPWPPCDGFSKHGPLRSPNGLCLRPSSHSCALNDSDHLVFDTDCVSDSTWFLFRTDGSLQHACSETCAMPLTDNGVPREGTLVGLSIGACTSEAHRFQKTAGVAFGKAIKYANGDLCLQSVSGDTPVKGEAAALRRKCAEGWDAFKRVYTFPNAECSYGLETGFTSDSQLSGSSALDASFGPQYGRLRNRTSAWCPRRDDVNPYFQVDLGYANEIKGVATQGHESRYWLVRTFTMRFSLDGVNWFEYTDSGQGTKLFNANSHPLIVKPNTLDRSVTARYVRIGPVQSYGLPCLRVALYRCSLRNADPYEL